MEYYSAIKKNEITAFAVTWSNLEIVILSEISQTEKEMSYDIPYMQNLKRKDTNKLIWQTENRLMDLENLGNCQRGRDCYRVWDKHVNTAKFKVDKQQGPTV